MTINTLHSNAIEVVVEAKRKATSSEVAKATALSRGANKFAAKRGHQGKAHLQLAIPGH